MWGLDMVNAVIGCGVQFFDVHAVFGCKAALAYLAGSAFGRVFAVDGF